MKLTSDFYVTVEFDFTQRAFVRDHYSLEDVIIRIGGSFAFMLPMFVAVAPLVMLYYIYLLAKII